jgi:hypothetical protein
VLRATITGLATLLPLVLLTSGAVAAEVVPGKDDRSAGDRGLALPTPVPCDDPVQTLTLAILEQYDFADSTSGEGAVDRYACRPGWDESGPEHVYALTASEPLILDAWLLDNEPDLDLIALSDCESDSCLAQANSEISAELAAGETLYLVVDGYEGAAGRYDLHLETRAVGIPESICEPGGAEAVDVAGALSQPLQGNLFEAPNLVSLADCSELAVLGGEVWYALTVAPADTDTVGIGYQTHLALTLEVTPAASTVDIALWLFDGCGPEATCLAFADALNAGGAETLEWANTDAESRTVYLAVDCFETPDQELAGAFDLLLDAALPVQRMSFEQLRRFFQGEARPGQ